MTNRGIQKSNRQRFLLRVTAFFIAGLAVVFPKTLYAIDLTGSWVAHSDGISGIADITGLVVHPENWNTVYALTAQNGIYKSTDGGATWTAKNAGLPTPITVNYHYLFENLLAIDNTTPDTLYVAIAGLVYRTTNGGTLWSLYSDGTTITCSPYGSDSKSNIIGVLIDRTNHAHIWSSTVASGCNGGIFEIPDTNTSSTWANIAGGLIPGSGFVNDAWQIVQSSQTPSILYFGTVHGFVRKSTDGGRTWINISPNGLHEATAVVRVHPLDESSIYVSGNNTLWKSTNGGTTWAIIAGLPYSATDMQFAPSSPSIVFAATPLGLYKSTDAGTSWSYLGHASKGINSIRIHPSDPNRLYLSSYGNGLYASSDGGVTLEERSSNLPVQIQIMNMGIHSAQSETLYVSVKNQGLYKSINGGVSWTLTGTNPSVGNAFMFAVDPSNNSAIYSSGSTLQKSTDSGNTWTTLLNTGSFIRSLAIAPSEITTILASSSEEVSTLRKSTDSGVSWSTVSNMAAEAIAFHPENPNIVYIANITGLWKSTNGGSTWTNLYTGREGIFGTGNAGVRFEVVSINPANGNQVFAANRSNKGFISDDGGNSWIVAIEGTSQIGKGTFSMHYPSRIYTSDASSIYEITKTGATYSTTQIPSTGLPVGAYIQSKFSGVIEDGQNPEALWIIADTLYKYAPATSQTPTPTDTPILTPSPTPTASPIPGDFNHDGMVTIIDHRLLISSFHQTNCAYNIVDSCFIDVFDYNALLTHYGQSNW